MDPLFSTDRGALGRIEFRPLDPGSDLAMVHDWVNRDYASFWKMKGMSLPEVESVYRDKLGRENYHVYIGTLLPSREPAFLLEVYHPVTDELGKYYDSIETDRAVHFIRAPMEKRIKDFSWHMILATTEFIFNDPSVQRIVREPDVGNRKMITLLLQSGFKLGPVLHLSHKTARFIYMTREQFNDVKENIARLPVQYSPNPLALNYHRVIGKILRRLRRWIG
jgi:RimJ/RimL family protein N-acetyltransferase